MENRQILIVDYGLGNLRSIVNAFRFLGVSPKLSSNPQDVRNAAAVVLPGVGSFREGIRNLRSRNLVEPIRAFAADGGLMLGICLGMQLLFEEGHEFGRTDGLGVIAGRVTQLPLKKESGLRKIHVTWNSLFEARPGSWSDTILCDLPNGADVYFVHSYIGVPERKKDILSLTRYGDVEFCSAVRYLNVFGTQFHPEKSGPTGLSILRRFCRAAGDR